MISAAAKTFAKAPPTPASFKKLVKADPDVAGSWLLRFADTAGISGPAIDELKKLGGTKFKTAAAKEKAFAGFFTKNTKVADMVDLAKVQTARANTLGFTVVEPAAAVRHPAYLTGVVKMNAGVVQLETGGKTFNVNSPNWQASLQFDYFEANALGAFEGKTVTVKAYPTDGDTLAIEEFAPGVGTNFVSGRLQDQGGEIGVRVRPDKWVAIKDPELKKLLHGYARLGVIFTGKVKQDGDKFSIDPTGKDFWMLAANSQFGGAVIANTVAMAHGQSHPVKGDISTKATTRRLLILGHIDKDANTVVAKKALATPEVRHENGVPFSNDSKALAALTPVELPDAAPDGFEA